MNFIGEQGNLKDDLISVLRTLDLKFDEGFIRDYPPIGVSKKPNNPIVWDNLLKAEVLKLEYAGLVRYGYTEPAAN